MSLRRKLLVGAFKEAYNIIGSLGLSALMTFKPSSLWRAQLVLPAEPSFERVEPAFNAQAVAEELFDAIEQAQFVREPVQICKRVISIVQPSVRDEFSLRAILSEIGWIETVLARQASDSVFGLCRLLQNEDWKASSHVKVLINTIEAFRDGLVATWETPSQLYCLASNCRT